ncbi:MAG: aquaporin [Planctomycetota bacterium]
MAGAARGRVCGFVAEYIGTFALVFFGCGSILVAQTAFSDAGAAGLVVVAIGFGAVLLAVVTAFLPVSGAQFNPAVSIALIVAGKQSVGVAGLWIVAQLLGAASGAGMLVFLLGTETANNPELGTTVGATLGTGRFAESPVLLAAFEGLLIFFLMIVILFAIVDERGHPAGAGVWVAFAVMACIAAGGPHTHASMNPARSFGPALYGHWERHWAYWAGPIAGACLASAVWRLMRSPSSPAEASR